MGKVDGEGKKKNTASRGENDRSAASEVVGGDKKDKNPLLQI